MWGYSSISFIFQELLSLSHHIDFYAYIFSLFEAKVAISKALWQMVSQEYFFFRLDHWHHSSVLGFSHPTGRVRISLDHLFLALYPTWTCKDQAHVSTSTQHTKKQNYPVFVHKLSCLKYLESREKKKKEKADKP